MGDGVIPAKVCPRCGAQYETLKSTTCPQCFAKLVIVDDATAEELKAARDSVERTPEFRAAKAADDEKFQEQSFGACLSVLALTLLTVVVVIALIVGAVHRQHRQAAGTPPSAAAKLQTGSLDILTQLPVAAALPDDVLPAVVGPYRRVSRDEGITLSGTFTPLFHGVYTSGGKVMHLYAIPASLPTPQQNQFRQGILLAAQIAAAPTQTFATEHWRYAAIGPAGETQTLLDGFRRSLGTDFRAPRF